jgi:hypothetical protein
MAYFKVLSRNLPDSEKNFKVLSRNLPDSEKNFKVLSRNLPDSEKKFKVLSRNLSDNEKRYCSEIYLLVRQIRDISQDIRCPGPDSNRLHLGYNRGALSLDPHSDQ